MIFNFSLAPQSSISNHISFPLTMALKIVVSGSLDVVRLLGAVFFFVEVDREGGSERVVCCGG